MLRNIILALMVISANTYAENKPEVFSVFYALNNTIMRPGLVKGMLEGCKESAPADCQRNAELRTNEVVAYLTYRMTTEKTIQDAMDWKQCALGDNKGEKCAAILKYTTEVLQGYRDVAHFQEEVINEHQNSKLNHGN